MPIEKVEYIPILCQLFDGYIPSCGAWLGLPKHIHRCEAFLSAGFTEFCRIYPVGWISVPAGYYFQAETPPLELEFGIKVDHIKELPDGRFIKETIFNETVSHVEKTEEEYWNNSNIIQTKGTISAYFPIEAGPNIVTLWGKFKLDPHDFHVLEHALIGIERLISIPWGIVNMILDAPEWVGIPPGLIENYFPIILDRITQTVTLKLDEMYITGDPNAIYEFFWDTPDCVYHRDIICNTPGFAQCQAECPSLCPEPELLDNPFARPPVTDTTNPVACCFDSCWVYYVPTGEPIETPCPLVPCDRPGRRKHRKFCPGKKPA